MLIENKEQLLSSAKSEDRHQTFTASLNNRSHVFYESLLSDLAFLMFLHTVCTFNDQYIDFEIWELSGFEMPVLFSAIIARVQYFDAVNID